MSPLNYLVLSLLISLAAVGMHAIASLRRRRILCNLARRWQMHYSPVDRLRLGQRIVESVPLPGPFDIRVIDLIFRTDKLGHRYLFTIEYGLGVVRAKRRCFRVAGFDEPITRGQAAPVCRITLAPDDSKLVDAYRYVNAELDSKDTSVPR